MPTWKKKHKNGETEFHHLCTRCNDRLDDVLLKDNWQFLRDGEPVSCNVCSLKCVLTMQGLWGEPDAVRFEVCDRCAAFKNCALQGRYFC